MKTWCRIFIMIFLVPGCGGGTIGTGVHPPPHSLFRDRILELPEPSITPELFGTGRDTGTQRDDEVCDRGGRKGRCPR
jgi:hypothetical protein